MPDKQLRIPQGAEAFYLEEAYAHRELLRSFEDLCSSWGYLPVLTPVFDFNDVYRGVNDDGPGSSYRLVDRDGEVLVLRSDITLFLARQMGMIVGTHELPARVYYGDTILRHEDPNDLSKNEFFQIGAELIGNAGIEADAEIVLLLLDAAARLGASETVLHIGSRALVRASSPSGAFAAAIAGRDWHAAGKILRSEGARTDRIDALTALYRFIGPTREFQDMLSATKTLIPTERAALRRLMDLTATLDSVGYGERIRVDLSEVGDQDYYTGVVFHLYERAADAPVASGGRYDDLLGRFGSDAPSVGFSLMLRRLQSRLAPDALPPMPITETAAGPTFRDRFLAATDLRTRGKVVHL